MRFFVIWFIAILLFFMLLISSCAKPNDTFAPQESVLKIDTYYKTPGYARDFTIHGNYLFTTVDQMGFSVFDIVSDTLVLNYNQYLNSPRIIDIAQDTLLFVYDLYGSPASINCFNISDVKNPTYLPPILSDTAGLEDMNITSTEGSDTLWITYTKNDASAHKIKKISATFSNYVWQFNPIIDANQIFDYDVHGYSNYQNMIYYIANEQKGIAVLDVSDPQAPVLEKYIDTPGSAYDVKRVNNYLFVADKHEGFEIFKLSQDDDWQLIYHYDTSGYAKKLAYTNEFVAVASGGGGVYVFDITNPDSVSLLGHLDDNVIGYTYNAKFFNGDLYVATRNGVYKMDIEK